MRTAGLFVLALAVTPVSVLAQDPPRYLKHLVEAAENERVEEDHARHDELASTIARIRNAIETENAGALEKCMIPRKIYLALGTRADEVGYYGRSQVKFMFGKLFRERQTRSFTYDAGDIEAESDDSAHFHAAWTYVVLDEDDVVNESLRFKLERSGGDWRITEIRAAAR